MTAPTTRETADHIGEANEKVADHIGDATTMIDHAELARLAEDALIPMPEKRRRSWFNRQNRFRGAFTPAVCSALLSEIAALRGDLTVSRDDLDQLQAHFRQRDREATQAERQRDELRKALEPFAEAAESLDDETSDHDHIWEQPAAMSIDAGHLRTARALLANQGADK